MIAPTITLAQLSNLKPCGESLKAAEKVLPKRRRITAAMARDAGFSQSDIIWVLSRLARQDKDVDRRLRLWMADCAARVLHIYEKTGSSISPRDAITAARQYARGEIKAAAGAAARAAAGAAAGAAARAAAWDAAGAAAGAAARAAAWDAAGAAAWDAARAAARAAAWDAAGAAAGAAARAAEEAWQLERLIFRMSDDEPDDWPLADFLAETPESAA